MREGAFSFFFIRTACWLPYMVICLLLRLVSSKIASEPSGVKRKVSVRPPAALVSTYGGFLNHAGLHPR